MKKRYLFSLIILIGLLQIAGTQFSSQFPSRRSKAPGESSCGGCHTGNVNTGSGSNQLSLPVDYVPDSIYTLSFTLNDNTFSNGKNGFTVTALDGNNLQAGTFGVITTGNTAVLTGSVGGQTRQYVGHRNASTNQTWNFTWQAPSTNVGDITFYMVGNAANGNGSNGGDFIYESNTSLSLNPLVPLADFAASSLELCPNEAVTFTNNSSGVITSYQWNFGADANPATSTDSIPPTVQYSTGGTKTVSLTVSGPNGSQSASRTIQVSNTQITAFQDQQICAGSSALASSQVGGGFPPYSYLWTSDSPAIAGISDPNSANPVINPNTAGPVDIVYTLAVTDSRGCGPVSSAFTLTVSALPEISLTSDVSICEGGDSLTLAVTPSSNNQGDLPFIYIWVPNGATTDSIKVLPETSTTYSVAAFSAQGCQGDAASVKVTVLDNPVPNIAFENDQLRTDTTGSSYQWYATDANNPDFAPLMAQTLPILDTNVLPNEFDGEILVEVTYANGCTRRSSPFTLTLTDIDQVVGNWSIYPNPSKGLVWIEIEKPGKYQVYDLAGKRVISGNLTSGQNGIDLSAYSRGLYLLQLDVEGIRFEEKIMIQ